MQASWVRVVPVSWPLVSDSRQLSSETSEDWILRVQVLAGLWLWLRLGRARAWPKPSALWQACLLPQPQAVLCWQRLVLMKHLEQLVLLMSVRHCLQTSI